MTIVVTRRKEKEEENEEKNIRLSSTQDKSKAISYTIVAATVLFQIRFKRCSLTLDLANAAVIIRICQPDFSRQSE